MNTTDKVINVNRFAALKVEEDSEVKTNPNIELAGNPTQPNMEGEAYAPVEGLKAQRGPSPGTTQNEIYLNHLQSRIDLSRSSKKKDQTQKVKFTKNAELSSNSRSTRSQQRKGVQ